MPRNKVLLTGASGYIGGRLLRELEGSDEFEILCLARNPNRVRSTLASTRIIKCDLAEFSTISSAFEGVGTAFYLIHSLGEGGDLHEKEQLTALNFARAVKEAGVEKIIYLGGLGDSAGLSEHLQSRQAVGQTLRTSGVPVIEFRAGIILGAGSTSYQIVSELTERLPLMICPRWVVSQTQPISVHDILEYLKAAVAFKVKDSVVYEVGGSSRVSYRDLMLEYARLRKLKRFIIDVPVLTPYLSSLWLGFVTSLHAKVGRKLIEGLRNDTIVKDLRALDDFEVEPLDMTRSYEATFAEEEAMVINDTTFASSTSQWFKRIRVVKNPCVWLNKDSGSDVPDSGVSLLVDDDSGKGVHSLFQSRWNKVWDEEGKKVFRLESRLSGLFWLRIERLGDLGIEIKLVNKPRGIMGLMLWKICTPFFRARIEKKLCEIPAMPLN